MSSIVRHRDKKSGQIIVYESISCYDAEKKTSRPKKKYLGVEDPVTHQLIPSSGKPGRKKKSEVKVTVPMPQANDPRGSTAVKQDTAPLVAQIQTLESQITVLQKENESLRDVLESIQTDLNRIPVNR